MDYTALVQMAVSVSEMYLQFVIESLLFLVKVLWRYSSGLQTFLFFLFF